MVVQDVSIVEESRSRYLAYALSVVNSRALPDVRDGLKPVQRRILYAMYRVLRLEPSSAYRKSAAVIGEVLARFHPHGDSACYDALVRMAQDFSLRYPLIDGQGNFGSMDGDSAAAYRYTEARLTKFALEVVGDLGQATLSERDNFDQTTTEPVVLPARAPNLLVNGASGIAVGMATAIPPHNLADVIQACLLLLKKPDASVEQLVKAIKGPDFPTGCEILNTKAELEQVYKEGRGSIRMRGSTKVESMGRGKKALVISSVPYAVDKSQLVEKIADYIVSRKLPQLVDVRDESTSDVRIVMELASSADPEKAIAFLCKNTQLQQQYHVNLTALVPTDNPLSGQPRLLSLREMLHQFIEFRLEVTRSCLENERVKLEQRLHLIAGLLAIVDVLDKVIAVVRKADGRADAIKQLVKKFKLSELQAQFIVDLRIYQLSRTNVEELTEEEKQKKKRLREITSILKSEEALRGLIADDLARLKAEFGDKRRCSIINDFSELSIDSEAYIEHEEVYVLVTKDGWLKRIRHSNNPETARVREGDQVQYVLSCNTSDLLVIVSSKGNLFATQVYDLVSTSGYGEPIQKLFRFADGEKLVTCRVVSKKEKERLRDATFLFFTERGLGARFSGAIMEETKKSGRRVMRVAEGDVLQGVCEESADFYVSVTEQSYAVCFCPQDVPQLSSVGKGVILQRVPSEDRVLSVIPCGPKDHFYLTLKKGKREHVLADVAVRSRAKRGQKLIKRGGPVVSCSLADEGSK